MKRTAKRKRKKKIICRRKSMLDVKVVLAIRRLCIQGMKCGIRAGRSEICKLVHLLLRVSLPCYSEICPITYTSELHS